jgi:uncharacterized protein with HXXEE motif
VSRFQSGFGVLILAQAVHSAEEYVGRLWESFLPARVLPALISEDLDRGFLILNVALVAFGLWCWLGPVRRSRPSAKVIAWGWIVVELVNAAGHTVWAIIQSGYTPGIATAPLLFVAAMHLAWTMSDQPDQ